MIYTVQEIQSRVMPVAKKYGIKAVFLFGSYAKGTATEDSDIDLLIDTAVPPSAVCCLWGRCIMILKPFWKRKSI